MFTYLSFRMKKCGIGISGIEDKIIKETFFNTMELFKKEGYNLKDKIRFLGKGYISIRGIGRDRRCAFCEYLRKSLIKHFKRGEIVLINCPFNPDKMIDHTPETENARKRLMEMFVKKHGPVVVENIKK